MPDRTIAPGSGSNLTLICRVRKQILPRARLPGQGENGVCSRLNGTDAKTAGERDAHFCETTDRTDFG